MEEYDVVPDHCKVEIDELWAAGNRTLADADADRAIVRRPVMLAATVYGDPALRAAGARFADRFDHTLRGMADDVEDAGRILRGSAQAYEYMDCAVAETFDTRGADW